MAYLALEQEPDLEFTYYLADRLRMTVSELVNRVSNAEFLHWAMYHGRKAQRSELAQKMAAHEKG